MTKVLARYRERSGNPENIDSMVGETWWDSVMVVLAHGPPTGDVYHNRKTAADLAKEYPFQALFPKVRRGGERSIRP